MDKTWVREMGETMDTRRVLEEGEGRERCLGTKEVEPLGSWGAWDYGEEWVSPDRDQISQHHRRGPCA